MARKREEKDSISLRLERSDLMILTDLQSAFAVAQMHAIAETIAPHLTFGTVASAHPFAVAIFFEFVLPYSPEAIVVDVSLVIVAADAQAA